VNKYLKGAICAALPLLGAAGCNDFLKGGELSNNPNSPTSATAIQYFGSVQTNNWQFQTGDLARLVGMWTQQVTGVARQQQQIDQYYGVSESSYDGEFQRPYGGGGLVDIRKIDTAAVASGDSLLLGTTNVLEAWMIGTTADIWGDIPYSQAAQFTAYPTPVLDPQQDVYAAIQTKLSDAITELTDGSGSGVGSYDLVYGGDPSSWIALAHTLKARFYLHTALVDGATAYQNALTEAALGIQDNSGDYYAAFSGGLQGESNPWYQFMDPNGGTGRAGDLVAVPSTLYSMLSTASDPRVDQYYDPASATGLSDLRDNPGFPQPLVTANENLLIMAEAQFQTGDEAGALASLNKERALWAQKAVWHDPVTLAPLSGLTGNALYQAIMTEKYIVDFQNLEAWNDVKRSCIPALTSHNPTAYPVIPRRLLYGTTERQTNPNIPAPNAQPSRNWNDPQHGC
jgi:hypothetical protein